MLIPVTCPECQSVYQLEESMRGKRMRCPNVICRAVFEVPLDDANKPAENSVPQEEKPKRDQASNVVNMLPVLPAEIAEPEPALPSQTAITRPPVRRAPLADKPSVVVGDLDFPGDEPESPEASPISSGPREFGPGVWQTPPVRSDASPTSAAATALAERVSLSTAPATAKAAPRPAKEGRGPLLLILLMLLTLAGLGVGGYFAVRGRQEGNEEDRYKEAREFYDTDNFSEAADVLQKMLRDYPTSRNRAQYNFLRELASVRDAAEHAEDASQGLASVLQFLDIYQQDPLLKDRHGDVWQTLHKLTDELTALAEAKKEPIFLDQARKAWKHAQKFNPPAGARVAEVESKVSADFTRVGQVLAVRIQRDQAIAILRGLLREPGAAALQEARALATKAGLTNDPGASKILKELSEAHRASVVFVLADPDAKQPNVSEDDVPSLYVVPAVVQSSAKTDQPGVVLALAHGVLYALEPARGDVRWVRRVGIDTTILPQRVPATDVFPERLLILSSDSKSLTAVEAETGKTLWQRLLSEACLGQPVLVDHHLLVPTRSGTVEEIEVTEGRLQGRYKLGQSLSVGGVRQPGTPFVVFPAENFCVYVLDVARRKCVATLYTGHAPGSLRTLPAIWSEPRVSGDGETAGWLLLGLSRQATDEFVPYALPITDSDQKPAEPILRSKGRAWFGPWHDDEKLAWATDAGYLAIHGIRQKGNRDPLLFPLFKDDYFVAGAGDAGKSLLAHVDAENYWMLTRGRLHRLQSVFTAKNGPELTSRWQDPPHLGTPLHAAQIRIDDDGRKVLFITTQFVGRPTCLVSAIDARDGKIIWQRQLGLICQGPLVAVGDVVACPGAGGVVLFDAGKLSGKLLSWQAGNAVVEGEPFAAQLLLPRDKGLVRLAWTRAPQPDLHVTIWNERGEFGEKHTLKLPAPPHGTPALGKTFALLPLADGRVVRVPLGKGNFVDGPDWRNLGVEEKNLGHVVALGDDEFVITDGSRGITRIRWGDTKAWEKKAAGELSHRIVAPPASVGGRLVVADASDTITLLEADHLVPIRRWSLPGRITAGPFVRGDRIGCVVGKDRLFWFDPAKDQPTWDAAFVAEIVGEPNVVDGVIVIADLSGRIQVLDAKTGQPVGAGYTLKANAPPAAAPIAFRPGRIFVPLMDGTVILLPLESRHESIPDPKKQVD